MRPIRYIGGEPMDLSQIDPRLEGTAEPGDIVEVPPPVAGRLLQTQQWTVVTRSEREAED